ncbi:MAG: gas vesicle protein K [Pseudomonadota bacterium]
MSSATLELDAEGCAEAARKLLSQAGAGRDGRLKLDPDTVEQDLARLVLAILEFLRQLMELQAIRRMEAGALTPDEEERVGLTLMRAGTKIQELAAQFGVSLDDLDLNLGPFGRIE